MHELTSGYASTYNNLEDIDLADKMLDERDKDSTLARLGELFIKHNVEHIYGLRLLHKHNLLSENEYMLEIEENEPMKGPCLTTIATTRNLNGIGFGINANSWAWIEGKMSPLEFSTDTDVGQPLQDHASFIQEFGLLLEHDDVAHLLGLCIITRNFYKRHAKDPTAILVEETDSGRRANIVRFADPGEYTPNRLIHATWKFIRRSGAEFAAGCRIYCAAGSCVPFSACVRDDAGHSSQSTHSRGEHNASHTGGQ